MKIGDFGSTPYVLCLLVSSGVILTLIHLLVHLGLSPPIFYLGPLYGSSALFFKGPFAHSV